MLICKQYIGGYNIKSEKETRKKLNVENGHSYERGHKSNYFSSSLPWIFHFLVMKKYIKMYLIVKV